MRDVMIGILIGATVCALLILLFFHVAIQPPATDKEKPTNG